MRFQRRSTLVGLAGLVAGGGAVVGTGAFTSVEAERTVTVETAGDRSAALSIDTLDTPNSNEYVSSGSTLGTGETLSIDISNVNLEAITHINRLFEITNNGTQDVVVYIQEGIDRNNGNDSGNAIDFTALVDQFSNVSAPYGGDKGSNAIANKNLADISAPNGSPGSVGVLLPVGKTLEVGLSMDTSDDNLNNGVNADNDADVGSGTGADAGELLMETASIFAESKANTNAYQFKIA